MSERLYLVDVDEYGRGGEYVLLAKGMGNWRLWEECEGLENLRKFLEEHDISGACGGKSTLRLMDESEWMAWKQSRGER